ncbi:MAG TPA: anhydro-N-acetylmuramic acid kinase, partial [Acidobacteriaceae bacterium]|nr:anhydro-N-acetylmuramic acid kinase [Acidobacteriaceae bacterium]
MIAGKPKAMIVAGVMSGTSADGIDVAICRVSPEATGVPRVKVVAHHTMRYPAELRKAVLTAMDAKNTSTAELSRLNWRLGEVYAEAVEAAGREASVRAQLIACHGQTIYHQGAATRYLGAPVRCTWQTGEAAVIAERFRVPVVSDFRAADMAAGGQAAPLVPMFDFCVFRDSKRSRVLLNLGGIANLTLLPAACRAEDVLAFDTGPANMVIDACMERLFGRGFDRNGATAARGRVIESGLAKLLRMPYFSAPPPKSCGREEYGDAFVTEFIAACESRSDRKEDVIATATALTARTIADAYVRFCKPQFEKLAPKAKVELMAAG